MEWITNSLGRSIPAGIAGRKISPFAGAFADTRSRAESAADPAGHAVDAAATGAQRLIPVQRRIPARGRPNKLVSGWDDLLDRLDLRDGATISFHHHLRDGDKIIMEVVARLAARGLRGITIAPTALFPVHDALLPYIRSGVIAKVEGSMNGAIGAACSRGEISETCVLRSHGGRQRAIQEGDLVIDAAFIAAPCADPFGNANGLSGKSACGPLGYALPRFRECAHGRRHNGWPRTLSLPALVYPRRQRRLCARSGEHRRQREDRLRQHEADEKPDPAPYSGPDLPIHRSRRHHEGRFFLPGGGGGHFPRGDRLPRRTDAQGRGEGFLRPRRRHESARRPSRGRPTRLHRRSPEFRPGRRALLRPKTPATSNPIPSPPMDQGRPAASRTCSTWPSWAPPKWTSTSTST